MDGQVEVGRRARRGMAGVVLEVFSVVLGVLVALGVDGWSAERELQARADHARMAILAEVRANKHELDEALGSLEAAAGLPLASVAGRQGAPAGGGGDRVDPDAPREGSIGLTLPEFSRAAWQTSQMTDATSRLDFDWLISVAKAYETQALYSELSLDVVRSIAALGTPDQGAVLARLGGQLAVLLDVHRALAGALEEILTGETP